MIDSNTVINVTSSNVKPDTPMLTNPPRDDLEHIAGLFQWRGLPHRPNPLTWACGLNMRDSPLLNLTTKPRYLISKPTFYRLH